MLVVVFVGKRQTKRLDGKGGLNNVTEMGPQSLVTQVHIYETRHDAPCNEALWVLAKRGLASTLCPTPILNQGWTKLLLKKKYGKTYMTENLLF